MKENKLMSLYVKFTCGVLLNIPVQVRIIDIQSKQAGMTDLSERMLGWTDKSELLFSKSSPGDA